MSPKNNSCVICYLSSLKQKSQNLKNISILSFEIWRGKMKSKIPFHIQNIIQTLTNKNARLYIGQGLNIWYFGTMINHNKKGEWPRHTLTGCNPWSKNFIQPSSVALSIWPILGKLGSCKIMEWKTTEKWAKSSNLSLRNSWLYKDCSFWKSYQ